MNSVWWKDSYKFINKKQKKFRSPQLKKQPLEIQGIKFVISKKLVSACKIFDVQE